jgi:RNA polymerase sigma-70 factor (ECF subfamily)
LAEAIIFEPEYPNLLMEETAGINPPGAGLAQFEDVFKTHFKNLHVYAYTIIKDDAAAEEIVQNVFYKLWEKRDQVKIEQSLSAYLYRSVHNDCLNYLKHAKVKAAHQVHAGHNSHITDNQGDPAALKELREKIEAALNELPEQCRTVFQMSRFEGLRYRMIADELGISVKTVENHMGKALRLLRSKLAAFLPVLVLLFINVKNLLP